MRACVRLLATRGTAAGSSGAQSHARGATGGATGKSTGGAVGARSQQPAEVLRRLLERASHGEALPRSMLPPSMRPPSIRTRNNAHESSSAASSADFRHPGAAAAAAAGSAAAAAHSTAAVPARHSVASVSAPQAHWRVNGAASYPGAPPSSFPAGRGGPQHPLPPPPVMSASASATAAGGRRGVTLADELQEALLSETSLVQPADPRSANVVILGTPNAGKSTLVNRLVRSKISAVSHKRNTTRTSVLGVATRNNRQLVLFDTPGVLPKLLSNKYQKELSTAAWDSAEGADVAVLIVDAVKKIGPAELELFEKAKRLAESNPDVQLVLLMNKMDLCKPSSRGRALAEQLQTLAPFARTLFTSVLRDKGVKELEDLLYNSCVEREWEYASGSVTDQSASERVIELVREKIFHRVHQEIPYRVAITNRGWTELSDGSLRIDLQLAVDTRHQKLILVGKGDTTLGFIKQRALPEIEQLLQRKVHLFLKCISKD